MTLDELNTLPVGEVESVLTRCCGCARWAATMAERRPFRNQDELFSTADLVWQQLTSQDWKEAFSHHPKIGDVKGLREKFVTTRAWAQGEQSGASNASEIVLQELADGNRKYEEKFGYIFIVCATGKSAGEMLTLLTQRLKNLPDNELHIAAGEQSKITRLRLAKLLL